MTIHDLRTALVEMRTITDGLTRSPGELRCRELSIAITELETGILWLERAIAVLYLDDRPAERDRVSRTTGVS